MTDRYADLRALTDDSKDDKWMCVKYSPKTLGVGISGGPALFMVREGSHTDIEDVQIIVRNLLAVLNRARALLVDYDRMRDALWIATEHNALHFGEGHNTVIVGRAALAQEQGGSDVRD